MTQPIRAVVFDLGGVLVDWNPRHLYRKLLPDDPQGMEEFLATVCTQDWNEEQDRGRSLAEATALLVARHPEKAALIEAYYGRWPEMLAGAIEGTVAVMEALEARGVPLYALTNWSAETFVHARARFGFLQRFRDIVVSGDVGLIKPDPRIFHMLLQRNGLTAETSLFIDDVERNVRGATAVGLQAIRFEGPEALGRDLAGLGLL